MHISKYVFPDYFFKFSKEFRGGLRSILFYNRFSSSISALSSIESDPSIDLAFPGAQNSSVCLHEGFQKIPRRPPIASRHNPLHSSYIHEGSDIDSGADERLRCYSRTLRTCALNEGKVVHGHMIRNGIDPDLHLWNSLVFLYAKCGSFGFARQVFDDMPKRDVVSWTALISGLVNDGYGSDGNHLLCRMRREDGIRPNACTLGTALKGCSMCLDIDFGRQLHVEVIRLGICTDSYVGSALIDLYAKCGEMVFAERVFFCMPEKNVVSWNALMNGYAKMGDGEEVLRLYLSMTEAEMKFNKFTLANVLKGCSNSGYLREARVVHSLAIKIGSELDEFVGCCLLDMYSKCGVEDDALKVFMRIKDPNVVAWSAIIKCMDQSGLSEEAAKLFFLMRQTCIGPNKFTLASLVRAATNLFDCHYGESIHAYACKCGFESDSFVSNALITMYMKNGLIQNGCRVFELMEVRDSASWNALLAGFQDNETCDQGPRIFKQMLLEGWKPDMYTFVGILGSCSSISDADFGKQLHALIIKHDLDGHDSVGTTLIGMYSKSACLENAEVIFNRLIVRDLLTWTAIIAGYAQSGQGEKAVSCFNQMQQEGVKPNHFTLSSCLSGCSSLVTLKNGRQLHSLAIKAGLSGDTYVASALVDMYGKCRCIEDAETVFKGMILPSRVSWNTIICSLSQHGQGEKALKVFASMLDEGIMPDRVTFIGVLSACSHLGLLEEGKMLFNSLSNVYRITPTIEHYACMVNLLCRAGKFSEIENFIEEMKLAENDMIWETVLWACKMHGNVEFGQRAANKLFELETKTDYNHIMLSDIFAAKEKWDDVAKVREMMSGWGVRKEPGCSWVEVDGQEHVFYAQDNSHPKIKKIYRQLQQLTRVYCCSWFI